MKHLKRLSISVSTQENAFLTKLEKTLKKKSFEDPELTFNDKWVTIEQGGNSIKYFAAEASVLTAPQKAITFPDPEIELTADNMNTFAEILKDDIAQALDNSELGDSLMANSNESTQ